MIKCPLCGEALNNDIVVQIHIKKIHPQRTIVLNL